MAVKVTFTLDEETIRDLATKAVQLNKSKSQVVRDAIRGYQGVPDKLSDEERDRILAALWEFRAKNPGRSRAEVDAELAELRAVRRLPGRLHPVD